MATFTSAANTGATESTIISSIVQDELLRATKLRATVEDMSAMATKGVKTIELPKFATSFSGPAAQNVDGVTPVAAQTVDFAVDTLNLNKHVNLPYEIPDRVSLQTVIPLEAQLAQSAGQKMGIYIDDQIIARLRQPSTSAPDHLIDLDGSALSGVATAITLDGIAEARKLLNKQNLPETDRYLVIGPAQEKNMLAIQNFISAERYGSREALLNGEVGRVFGFRVIVSNGLADNEAFAYHKSAVAIAMQQDIKFETRRASLGLQKTEYSFTLLMGDVVLDGGKRQVHMLGA